MYCCGWPIHIPQIMSSIRTRSYSLWWTKKKNEMWTTTQFCCLSEILRSRPLFNCCSPLMLLCYGKQKCRFFIGIYKKKTKIMAGVDSLNSAATLPVTGLWGFVCSEVYEDPSISSNRIRMNWSQLNPNWVTTINTLGKFAWKFTSEYLLGRSSSKIMLRAVFIRMLYYYDKITSQRRAG